MSSVIAQEQPVERPTEAAGLPLPLVLRQVEKRWGELPVLAGVDLNLGVGTKTRIAGRNGVGKTTLLRIAAGLIDPDRGRAEASGVTARERPQRYQRLVSFLPAGDRGLYARLTVRRQLDFCARIGLLPSDEASQRVEEAIARFALDELASRRVDRLSMGQRQRVRIAMTFLPRPDVVLLDEPLTSLDRDGGALLDVAIEALLDQGGAVLWCSPVGERIDYSFDRTLVLERGRLVEQ